MENKFKRVINLGPEFNAEAIKELVLEGMIEEVVIGNQVGYRFTEEGLKVARQLSGN